MDKFMKLAIEEAKKGFEESGIPIGSVFYILQSCLVFYAQEL